MDRMVPNLLRTYRSKVVSPVIVQARANMFSRVRTALRDIVPVHLLEPSIHTFLPRIFKIFEVPLTKWKQIPTFNMVATILTPNLIEEVAQWREVEKIYPDYVKWALSVPPTGVFLDRRDEAFTTTYWTKKVIGADRANEQGFTGKGIRVLVADTGVRTSHPQLRRARAYSAMKEKGGSAIDSNGHGTHCVSTVGGTHATDPFYKVPVEGMAPECDLVSVQCLGFIIGMGMTSDVLEAMEMAITFKANIVSMSLGSEEQIPDEDNPEAKAIDEMVKRGIIPVIAAGNSGPNSRTVGSPGSVRSALTIGAWDAINDKLCDFSSRGPSANDEIKPDVLAPGYRVNSALVGFLDTMVDKLQYHYGSISGTSMSTPHIAGLAACMAQMYRERVKKELTVAEIKRMMSGLGRGKDNDEGWGLMTWDMVEEWVKSEYGVWGLGVI